MNEHEISSMIIIGFALGFIIYFLVNLPFSNPLHNYRAGVCHVSFIIILFVAMYYRNMKSNLPIEEIAKVSAPAIMVIVSLFVSLVFSAAMLVYEFIFFIKALLKKFKVGINKKISN